MRMTLGMAILPAAILGGCAAEPLAGPPEYIGAQVKQVSDTVFAVGIEVKNADEYAFVRCVAANHAKYQEAASFGELAGPPLHTRFLRVDGQRVTHSHGVRQFTIATAREEAPPKILSVRATLAKCKQNGIPTGTTGEGAG
jgi:hypothetical protein